MKINVEERVQRAHKLHKEGYSCSQVVVMTYADVFHLDEKLASQLGAPFGGGIARMQEVCGCIFGTTLLSAFISPAPDPSDRMAVIENRKLVRAFIDQFKAEYGDIICRNLMKSGKDHLCVNYIISSVKIIGEKLNQDNDI